MASYRPRRASARDGATPPRTRSVSIRRGGGVFTVAVSAPPAPGSPEAAAAEAFEGARSTNPRPRRSPPPPRRWAATRSPQSQRFRAGACTPSDGRRRSARPRRRGTPRRAGRVPNLRADACRRPGGGGRRAGERLEAPRGVREPRRARVHVEAVEGQLPRRSRPRFAPKMVEALRGVNATAVAAGARHTVAVDDMGEVYAWGSNEHGELGLDPPPPRRQTPPNRRERFGMDSRRVHHPAAARAAAARVARAAVASARIPVAAAGRAGRVVARGSTPRASAHGHGGRPRGAFDCSSDFARDGRLRQFAHSHNTFKALIAGVEHDAAVDPSRGCRRDNPDERFWGGWLANRATRRLVSFLAPPQLVAASRKSPRSPPARVSPSPFAARVARERTSSRPRAVDLCPPGQFSDRLSALECAPCLADPPLRRGSHGAKAARRIVRGRGGHAGVSPLSRGHVPRVGGAISAGASRVPRGRSARRRSARDACSPGSHEPASAARRARRVPPPPTSPANEADPRLTAWRVPAEVSATPRVRARARVPGTRSVRGGRRRAVASGTYARGRNVVCEPCPWARAAWATARGPHECPACPKGNYSSVTGATGACRVPRGLFETDGAAGARAPRGVRRARGNLPEACGRVPSDSITHVRSRASVNDGASSLSVSSAVAPANVRVGGVSRVSSGDAPQQNRGVREGTVTRSLGTFAPVSGLDVCLLCPPGTFMNETGATACHGCDPGI